MSAIRDHHVRKFHYGSGDPAAATLTTAAAIGVALCTFCNWFSIASPPPSPTFLAVISLRFLYPLLRPSHRKLTLYESLVTSLGLFCYLLSLLRHLHIDN